MTDRVCTRCAMASDGEAVACIHMNEEPPDINERRLRATTRASVWAEEFAKLHPEIDQGLMIGWFANAIETGRAAGRSGAWWPTPDGELRNPTVPAPRPLTAEDMARQFHEVYERLAPDFGYKTREASAVSWEQVPEANRRLMIATVAEVLSATVEQLQAELAERTAERDAADTVIQHLCTYWAPWPAATGRTMAFSDWTEDDWADSTWTPAEAEALRRDRPAQPGEGP